MRKGAATHVASGITSSPPIASICIRANWKMPGVMNRYIKYESAGDQYVGRYSIVLHSCCCLSHSFLTTLIWFNHRCVSGRDRLSKRFAESLPYFDLSDYSGLEREQKLRQLDRWIKDRMPAVAATNDAVFYLFKMCLASLIHHREWLNETLHSESPVRMTSFCGMRTYPSPIM